MITGTHIELDPLDPIDVVSTGYQGDGQETYELQIEDLDEYEDKLRIRGTAAKLLAIADRIRERVPDVREVSTKAA